MSSGSERVVIIALIALAANATSAWAQPATGCAERAEPVGWLGIIGLACNCTFGPDGWAFRSEPRVQGVARSSPADGVLREGDEIVAVNGQLITTREAGQLFGAPRPNEALQMTVRRNGALADVTLTPAPICPSDPRATTSTPVARGKLVVPVTPKIAKQSAPGSHPRLRRETGWFGFGITCSNCGWEAPRGDSFPLWAFSENPRLMRVEAGSPAERAGLRMGDELVRIDGMPLHTPAGGHRFGSVRPGQTVRWTYRRGDRELTVPVRATEPPVTPQPIRFQDVIGDVDVEVRGNPAVVTTIVEQGRELIIETPDARILIRARGGVEVQRRR
jgi:S1-C subfamily serine protease